MITSKLLLTLMTFNILLIYHIRCALRVRAGCPLQFGRAHHQIQSFAGDENSPKNTPWNSQQF